MFSPYTLVQTSDIGSNLNTNQSIVGVNEPLPSFLKAAMIDVEGGTHSTYTGSEIDFYN